MKKIGRSDIIGQRGMAHIESVALSMGFMFYPTGGVEAGIDGFIELREEGTGAVGNLLLQVQGKLRCQALGQPLQHIAAEPLALTKMNWNNTQFDNGLPITIAAARQVGEVLKYVPEHQEIAPRYSFYI
jgi:hypothetical protein